MMIDDNGDQSKQAGIRGVNEPSSEHWAGTDHEDLQRTLDLYCRPNNWDDVGWIGIQFDKIHR